LKIDTARFIRSALSTKDFIDDGLPEVAFAGRSNVGKSSLLNRLLFRKTLARISSVPGKTRAINYFVIDSSFYFVDLPGYGYAKVGKAERREWAKLMDEYLCRTLPRGMIVQLVDAKVGATPLDVQAFEYFCDLGASPTVVATKIDKVSRSKRAAQLGEIEQALSQGTVKPIPFSARSGEGVKELWREITTFLYGNGGEANENEETDG
jgi:GTP-binding protein